MARAPRCGRQVTPPKKSSAEAPRNKGLRHGDQTELSLQALAPTTVRSALQVGKTEHTLRFDLSNKGKPTFAPDVRNATWGMAGSLTQNQGPHSLVKGHQRGAKPQRPSQPDARAAPVGGPRASGTPGSFSGLSSF